MSALNLYCDCFINWYSALNKKVVTSLTVLNMG